MLKHLQRHFPACASQNFIFATALPARVIPTLGMLAEGKCFQNKPFLPWRHIAKGHCGGALGILVLSPGRFSKRFFLQSLLWCTMSSPQAGAVYDDVHSPCAQPSEKQMSTNERLRKEGLFRVSLSPVDNKVVIPISWYTECPQAVMCAWAEERYTTGSNLLVSSGQTEEKPMGMS